MPITSVRDYENNIWKRNAKRTKKKTTSQSMLRWSVDV